MSHHSRTNVITIYLALMTSYVTLQCTTRNTTPTLCGRNNCVNGECVTRSVETFIGLYNHTICECDDKWRGIECDLCCDLPCVHGKCHRRTTPGSEFCLCDVGWDGTLCDKSGSNDTPESSFEVEEQDTCNSTKRNESEYCFDKTCYHGFCKKTPHKFNDVTIMYGVCQCDLGWKGFECNKCCDLPCENGECDFWNGNYSHPFCNCENNYTGELCITYVPPPSPTYHTPEYYWYLIGVGCTVLLIIITVGSTLIFSLYKRRNYIVMKIIYKLKKFEEEDGRDYDAFLSYHTESEDDRKYVKNELYRKLEQQYGFKLCINQRDFMPGCAIAENVIDAVKTSRRTILVLSPEYCRDEWTQFELETAQFEAIKYKHRLIPIIFKDISEVTNMDPKLDYVIKTIPCLKWPGEDVKEKHIEKFWNKLKVFMPKRKLVANRNPENMS